MAPTLSALRARRNELLAAAARHGARNVRIFGSVARGEADDTSDVDLLVEMEHDRTLSDLVALEQDLSELLGCRVEVGTILGPAARGRAARDVTPL